MWGWLEKFIGIDDKPLVLTKEIKRARTNKGRYKSDDKSTPNINEAWVGGKAPKKIYKIKGRKYTLKKVIKERK